MKEKIFVQVSIEAEEIAAVDAVLKQGFPGEEGYYRSRSEFFRAAAKRRALELASEHVAEMCQG